MRVLVCGGRDYNNGKFLVKTLDGLDITHLIEGGAQGSDQLARQWALNRNIKITTYVAQWDRYGKSAGPRRNEQMLRESIPELVIAFPGGRGTAHMVEIARKAGVKVRTYFEESKDHEPKDQGGRIW